MSQVELIAMGRFEWEKIIRRIVVPSNVRAVKTVALMAATYANADGTNVYPGERLLADTCQMSERTVREALRWLRENHLIYRQSRGSNLGRQARADRYQLCAPKDLERYLILMDSDTDDPWAA